MKSSKLNLGTILFGVMGASSLVALFVYSQPSPSHASISPTGKSSSAGKSLVAQDSSTTSPSSTSSPSTSSTTSQRQNLVTVAASKDAFSSLVKAVKAAGLTETLSSKGPYTVFAPNDVAFAALPKGVWQNLLKPANKQELVRVLTYHIVFGNLTSSQLKSGRVKTVEGSPVSIKVSSTTRNGIMVNNAQVVQTNILASNGVIYAIDKVLLPPGLHLTKF